MCSKENNFKISWTLASALQLLYIIIYCVPFFSSFHIFYFENGTGKMTMRSWTNASKHAKHSFIFIINLLDRVFFYCVHTQAHLLWLLCFHFNRPFPFSYNIAKKKWQKIIPFEGAFHSTNATWREWELQKDEIMIQKSSKLNKSIIFI